MGIVHSHWFQQRLLGQRQTIIDVDENNSLLYSRLDKFNGIAVITETRKKSKIKVTLDDREIYIKADKKYWHSNTGGLITVSDSHGSRIIIRDSSGSGYYSYEYLDLSEHIKRHITLEGIADNILTNFKHLSQSKIYRLCKYYLIYHIKYGNYKPFSSFNKCIYYKFMLLLTDKELSQCLESGIYTDGDFTWSNININIVLRILDKANKYEYDYDELYEGVKISHTKRAL